MEHLREQDLAEWEYLLGERKAEALEHLQTCPECRLAVESHRRMLALLDEATVPEMSDQTDRVLAMMAKEKAGWGWQWPTVVKAAAAIVLSSGVGYSAGLFTRHNEVPVQADPQQAAKMLYLDELGASATGEFRNLFLASLNEETPL